MISPFSFKSSGITDDLFYFVYKLVEGNDSKDQTVITFMKAAKQLKPIVEKLYNNIKYNQVDLSELMNFINK